MPGENEKQIETTAAVETPEKPSDDIDTQDALTTLGTGIETWALEQEVMLTKVRELLNNYKSLKTWINSSEWNIQTRRQLEHRLNENIENLKNIWKDLWWDNKTLNDKNKPIKIKEKAHKYSDLTTYKARIWELEYFYSHYEQVRQIITLWWKTSDIHAIIDSKQDAKRARKYEKQDNKSQQEMNEILHDVAITSLRNNDMERYEEYLEAVVNWQIEPSSHPFYKAHCQSFNMIKHTNPSLYQMLAPSSWRRVQYGTPIVVRTTWWKKVQYEAPVVVWTIDVWNRNTGQKEAFHKRVGWAFAELMSNIFPDIEKDPRKKQAWDQLWSIAVLSWSIFMWFKAIQKAIFTKKEEDPKKRWKAAWWAAWLFALANSDRIWKSLIDFAQDISWRHPAEKTQACNELFQTYWFEDTEALQIAEMHIWAPVATLSALHFVPIYELTAQNIIEYQDNQFKFNYDNYKKYIDTYNWTADQKKVILAAWENLKNNYSLNDWLNALGVKNPDDLTNIANWDKNKTLAQEPSIQSRYLECTRWVTSGVNKELYKRWLRAKDVESAQKVVDEYEHDSEKKIDKLIKDRTDRWLLEVATNYPMVRRLSELWIKIEGNEDIEKTEERLKSIQEWMKYCTPWTQGYKPYSIDWNKLMFTTIDEKRKLRIPDDVQDTFPGQSRSLNDYPAVILDNKNKFLEFMNDPNNHMRWKEVAGRLP